jgi:hypothetical protein
VFVSCNAYCSIRVIFPVLATSELGFVVYLYTPLALALPAPFAWEILIWAC